MKRSLLVLCSLFLLFTAACSENEVEGCPDGQYLCSGECVDWQRDPLNCGACGTDCGQGVCEQGSCVEDCEGSKENCDGFCIDLDSSFQNCGACGEACAAGQVCHRGSCGTECGKDLAVCDQGCVDLDTNPDHCGDCGVRCGADEVCSSGQCLAQCEDDLRNCGGGCVDVRSDADHCGACGKACTDGKSCIRGRCACAANELTCPGSERCVDVQSDPENCGSCGVNCTTGTQVDGASCERGVCKVECAPGWGDCDGRHDNGCERNLQEDPMHCGACGVRCKGDEVCAAGQCVCPRGQSSCGGNCYDLTANPNNCGTCGNSCLNLPRVMETTTCFNSECFLMCPTGEWGNCDEDPSTGCETNLKTTHEHCGVCGNNCHALDRVVASHCSTGRCIITECEEGWRDCNGDPADGCEGDMSKLVLCGENNDICADLQSDRDFCGNCETRCTVDCREAACLDVQGVALTLGSHHSCAILSDSTIRCWGRGHEGQLGDGQRGSEWLSSVPVPVLPAADSPAMEEAMALSLGASYSCALMGGDEAGMVRCWGDNQRQKAGGAPERLFLRYPALVESEEGVPLSGVIQVAAGPGHTNNGGTCVLLEGGKVSCWGANSRGQLGDGTTTASRFPRAVLLAEGGELSGASQISVGVSHSCARMEDGSVRCWGDGGEGQLGQPLKQDQNKAVLVQVSETGGALGGVKQVVAGDKTTCALLENGEVRCWGDGRKGQIGDGALQPRDFPRKVQAEGSGDLTGVSHLAIGSEHVCALLESGGVSCWGRGQHGRIGDGSQLDRTRAVPVIGEDDVAISGVATLAAGAEHSCVQLQSGPIYCWGSNEFGQVGDGPTPGGARTKATIVRW